MTDFGWEHFEHSADLGVRGRGATLAEAFEQAALALTAAATDPAGVEPRTRIELRCHSEDPEILLVDWLNALIHEMACRDMLFGSYQVTIHDGELKAHAWGEPVDRRRHAPAVEVKGATFTALRVAPEAGGWVAQCVVDV